MNGYGGGYGRGRGWGRPPVYPSSGGAIDAKRTWTVRHQVLNIQQNPGTTQSNTSFLAVTAGNAQPNITVKHIKMSVNAGSATTQAVFWAIVYVPAGTSTLALSTATNSNLYPASQFVMSSGSFIADADAEPVSVYVPVARKLNPGDQIVFACIGTNAAAYQLIGTLKMAVGV